MEIDLVDTTCLGPLIWRASCGVWPTLMAHRRPMPGTYHAPHITRIFTPLSMPRNLVDTSHVNYREHRTEPLSAILVRPPRGDRWEAPIGILTSRRSIS